MIILDHECVTHTGCWRRPRTRQDHSRDVPMVFYFIVVITERSKYLGNDTPGIKCWFAILRPSWTLTPNHKTQKIAVPQKRGTCTISRVSNAQSYLLCWTNFGLRDNARFRKLTISPFSTIMCTLSSAAGAAANVYIPKMCVYIQTEGSYV